MSQIVPVVVHLATLIGGATLTGLGAGSLAALHAAHSSGIRDILSKDSREKARQNDKKIIAAALVMLTAGLPMKFQAEYNVFNPQTQTATRPHVN